MLAAAGAEDTGFVFQMSDGAPFDPGYLTRTFQTISARCGLPPIRLHDLRHTAASLALQAGVQLKIVQETLRHSSIVLTADTYISILPDAAREAADATAALILKHGRLVPGTARPRRPAAGPSALLAA